METTGERWRLGHRPALDGLRGVAVLMVILEHVGFLRLGQVGVGIFFTLSGFLITALLLEEHEATGSIRLRHFYLRRLFRLAPALVVMVAFVVLLDVATGLDLATWGDVVAALGYVSNWHFIGHGLDGALLHTWSLGVEEQFYLVFPVVLIVGLHRGRRFAGCLMVGGVVFAVVLRAYLWDSGASLSRLGYGFDTRLDGLLVGCLLAVWMRGRGEGTSRPLLALGAVGALTLVGVTLVDTAPVAWPLAVALLAAVAIFACARGRGGSWLSARWLTLVGRRSYGLYLWHFPVASVGWMVADRSLVSISVVVAVSWCLALLSWRYVEEPFLRRRRSDERAPAAEAGLSGVVLHRAGD